MYQLNLTDADRKTIAFVGDRYDWSNALLNVDHGESDVLSLSEPEAWELAEAFEADMEGGHSPFPMLDPDSELYDKLQDLWDSIV